MAHAFIGHTCGPRPRAPLPLELILEVLEDPRLGGEVVVLLLLIGRRPGPVGRAEHGQRTSGAARRRVVVEEHQLLVIQAGMSADTQRHAGGVQPVEVVGHPLPVGKPVFLVVADQPDWNSAPHRGDDEVGLALVGDAIHDHVEPFRLLRIARRETGLVVLRLRKVQRRVLRIDRIPTGRRVGDVRVVLVIGRLDPVGVVLRHEALDNREVVGEIERFILEVDVRRLRNERGRAEVRA